MDDKKINSTKINKANRSISSNINSLFDKMQSSIFGNSRETDIEKLNTMFNTIVNDDLENLNKVTDGDISSFVMKLVSSSERSNAIYKKLLNDPFSTADIQSEAILTEAYQNRLLKQSDLHEIASQLNELREAILITRDSICSSDIVEENMTRILEFKNYSSIENSSSFIPVIEKMEEKFKLAERIKNFIIPKTLEYGEYYVYVIPYSKIFSTFKQYKDEHNFSNYGMSFTESVSINDFYSETNAKKIKKSKDIGNYLFEYVSEATKDEYSSLEEHMSMVKELTHIMENVSVNNIPVPLSILEEGVEAFNELVDMNGSLFTEEGKSSNKKSSGDIFYKTHNIDKGVMTDKHIEFDEIKDCYIKLINPTRIIPVDIMGYVVGYYYIIDENSIPFTNSTISNVLYSNVYNNNKREATLVDNIATEIIKAFDKKFLMDNLKFKELIVEAINYYNLNERRIRFQYIPKEYIIPFKINEDEDGRGTSIIEHSLFYAKLYLLLLLFKMSSIVSYSNDTKVHYIKQSGIDTEILGQVKTITRKMRNQQPTLYDLLSYSNLINKIGHGQDRFVPVGKSGERGLETEIIGGQDVQLNTDFMEMLKQGYISATGVPAVIMNYINEADYAKTLELANTRYLGRIVSDKLDFNKSITVLYQKIMEYSTNIPKEAINAFTYTLPSPKYGNGNITNDLISSFASYSDFAVSIVFGDNASGNEEFAEAIQEFKLAIAKERLPMLNIDRLVELGDESLIKAKAKQLNPNNTQEQGE